jgi:hypothetical protein
MLTAVEDSDNCHLIYFVEGYDVQLVQ